MYRRLSDLETREQRAEFRPKRKSAPAGLAEFSTQNPSYSNPRGSQSIVNESILALDSSGHVLTQQKSHGFDQVQRSADGPVDGSGPNKSLKPASVLPARDGPIPDTNANDTSETLLINLRKAGLAGTDPYVLRALPVIPELDEGRPKSELGIGNFSFVTGPRRRPRNGLRRVHTTGHFEADYSRPSFLPKNGRVATPSSLCTVPVGAAESATVIAPSGVLQRAQDKCTAAATDERTVVTQRKRESSTPNEHEAATPAARIPARQQAQDCGLAAAQDEGPIVAPCEDVASDKGDNGAFATPVATPHAEFSALQQAQDNGLAATQGDSGTLVTSCIEVAAHKESETIRCENEVKLPSEEDEVASSAKSSVASTIKPTPKKLNPRYEPAVPPRRSPIHIPTRISSLRHSSAFSPPKAILHHRRLMTRDLRLDFGPLPSQQLYDYLRAVSDKLLHRHSSPLNGVKIEEIYDAEWASRTAFGFGRCLHSYYHCCQGTKRKRL